MTPIVAHAAAAIVLGLGAGVAQGQDDANYEIDAAVVAQLRSQIQAAERTAPAIEAEFAADPAVGYARERLGFSPGTGSFYRCANGRAWGRDGSGRLWMGLEGIGGCQPWSDDEPIHASGIDRLLPGLIVNRLIESSDLLVHAARSGDTGVRLIYRPRLGTPSKEPRFRPNDLDRELRIDDHGRVIAFLDRAGNGLQFAYDPDDTHAFAVPRRVELGNRNYMLRVRLTRHSPSQRTVFTRDQIEGACAAAATGSDVRYRLTEQNGVYRLDAGAPSAPGEFPTDSSSHPPAGAVRQRSRVSWPLLGTGVITLLIAAAAWWRTRQ